MSFSRRPEPWVLAVALTLRLSHALLLLRPEITPAVPGATPSLSMVLIWNLLSACCAPAAAWCAGRFGGRGAAWGAGLLTAVAWPAIQVGGGPAAALALGLLATLLLWNDRGESDSLVRRSSAGILLLVVCWGAGRLADPVDTAALGGLSARSPVQFLALLSDVETSGRPWTADVAFWRERSAFLGWPVWPGWAVTVSLAVLGLAAAGRRLRCRVRIAVCAGVWISMLMIVGVTAERRLPLQILLAVPAGHGLSLLASALRGGRWSAAWAAPILATVVLAATQLPGRFDSDRLADRREWSNWLVLSEGFRTAGQDSLALDARRRGTAGLRLWLRLRPGDQDARTRLAEALLQDRRLDEAAAHLEIALRQDPRDRRARQAEARLLLGRDQAGAALRRFEALAREEPTTAVLLGKAECLLAMKRGREARPVLEEILRTAPDDPLALRLLAALDQGS